MTDANVFTCAMCGETFQKEWSDEEAQFEAGENGLSVDECGLVCDDCYKKTPWGKEKQTPELATGDSKGEGLREGRALMEAFEEIKSERDRLRRERDEANGLLDEVIKITDEFWQTLCHYDHDDISTNWNLMRPTILAKRKAVGS